MYVNNENTKYIYRMRSCENAIGVMTKLQTSLVAEETWVDGATEKLSVLPTATSALELDVSNPTRTHHKKHHPSHIFLYTSHLSFGRVMDNDNCFRSVLINS